MSETALATKTAKTEKSLKRLKRLAHLMDNQFELPIIRYRVGLDPIIGLIPGGGDWVTFAVSIYILWESIRLEVPFPVLLKMTWNLTLDFLAGYIPVVGDIADAVIKANAKNVELVFACYDAHVDPLTEERIIVRSAPPTLTKKQKMLLYVAGAGIIVFLFTIVSLPFVLLYYYLR